MLDVVCREERNGKEIGPRGQCYQNEDAHGRDSRVLASMVTLRVGRFERIYL